MPEPTPKHIEDMIIELRQKGLTYRAIQGKTGVATNTIAKIFKRRGVSPTTLEHGPPGKGRPIKPTTIEDIIKRYGPVYADEGLNGGFIAIVNDEYVGPECKRLIDAVRKAVGEE